LLNLDPGGVSLFKEISDKKEEENSSMEGIKGLFKDED